MAAAQFGKRRWSPDHRVARLIGALAIAATAIYLSWRLVATQSSVPGLLFWPLVVGEILGGLRLVSFTAATWKVHPVTRPTPQPQLTIDVCILVEGHRVDRVRAGLLGAQALGTKHHTWILDTDGRTEIELLSREFGVKYFGGTSRTALLNTALMHSKADLLLLLDGDQVPMPDIYEATSGYFADSMVAIVQTATEFVNRDSLEFTSSGRHLKTFDFEVTGPSLSARGMAPWWVGASIVRREALKRIGGFAAGVGASELRTLIRLHRAGWLSRFHNEVVVRGTAPNTLRRFLDERRDEVARRLRVMLSADSPLFARGLRPRQRITHLSPLSQPVVGFARLAMYGVLFGSLVLGRVPISASAATLVAFFAPVAILSTLAHVALGRGSVGPLSQTTARIRTLGIAVGGSLRALAGEMPTVSYDGDEKSGLAKLLAMPFVLALTIALEVVIVVRIYAQASGKVLPVFASADAAVMVVGVGIWHVGLMLATLQVLSRRQQYRSNFRLQVELHASTEYEVVRVIDITPAGIGVAMAMPHLVHELIDLTLLIPAIGGEMITVRLAGSVRFCEAIDGGEAWRIGMTFADISTFDRDRIIEYYSLIHPFRTLRGLEVPNPSISEVGELQGDLKVAVL